MMSLRFDMFPHLLHTHCNCLSLHCAQIGTPTSWLQTSILVCTPHILRLENFWGHIFGNTTVSWTKRIVYLTDLTVMNVTGESCTPIDLIVMTLVCLCVTTVCAVKHNHDEVTVWMEQVCFKFSIFVLFKKLAIWLTSLHLPTVHLWFFTNQEAEPKNRCGWAQATRIWE